MKLIGKTLSEHSIIGILHFWAKMFLNKNNFISQNYRSITETTVMGSEAKEKYRGVFEFQKSGDKTSSGEIGLDIRTHASPKVGQDRENIL